MATLVYSDADGVDRSFALGTEVVLVGRGDECAIKSSDPRVSRQHARFFLDQGVLWIEDLGSSTGTYVGPNKIQRAPVPTGEIILAGSLVIRLLPASGTLPPPMGLHGTLAVLLDLERKTRSAVEEERDAFAKRVGELHQELRAAQQAPATTLRDGAGLRDVRDQLDTLRPDGNEAFRSDQTAPAMMSEAIRLRDESEAKTATLERTLAAMQDEMQVLRNAAGPRAEWSGKQDVDKLALALDEAEAARSIAEHAAGEANRESMTMREELDSLRRQSTADLESMRLELVKSREAKMMSDTAAGMQVAEKLAEADMVVSTLQRELEAVKANVKAVTPSAPDARMRELTELNAVVTGRAEKAEKDLAAAQIRAQGAERNLAHASTQAAKAEARASQVDGKLADAEARAKAAAVELAQAQEQIVVLELRASGSPMQAAEARSAKLAAEVAELTSQLGAATTKLAELQETVAETEQQARDADERAITAATELSTAQGLLTEAEDHARSLQAKLAELAGADSVMAEAAKAKQNANERTANAESQVTEATRRAEDAEKRASAADTMAKAMAKDVAEALRRAAEADMRARGVSRELDNAHRRADKAEAVGADVASTIKDAQRRAVEAEARVVKLTHTLETKVAELEAQRTDALAAATREHAEELAAATAEHTAAIAALERELGGRAQAVERELSSKLETTQKDLGTRLEAAQRELAAERTSSLALVDRKTQLERELAETRIGLERGAAAEARLIEREDEIEALNDKVLDLESGIAVSETAQQASLEEARAQIKTLKAKLAEAEPMVAKAQQVAADLGTRVSTLESQLAEAIEARASAETALSAARLAVADLEREAADLTLQDQLDDARARADEAERKLDGLEARAEAADLAIGRAGALQRQLDEAIQKLTWLEREAQSKTRESVRQLEQSDAIVTDRVAGAEARQREAEARAKEAETRFADAERRAQQAAARNDELVTDAEAARATAETTRATAEETRSIAAELQLRLDDAEARCADALARLEEAEQTGGNLDGLQAQVAQQQQRIAALEREVATADNVRSFAAETEREIAQLQRDLRETRSKLTQMTLERDRLELEVRDSRSDSETTNERAPLDAREIARIEQQRRTAPQSASRDPEDTANFDVARFEQMIARTGQLEKQLAAYEHDNKLLVQRIAETEQKLRDAIDGDDDDANVTRTGSGLPVDMAEHVSVIEESIDSLRANMRAASDETAIMEQSDSVVAVSSAVSQAAEHIERARAAIKQLARSIGMS